MKTIYIITNKINGKKYVGQTINSFAKRMREHKCKANLNKGFAIHNAIRKYGIENFHTETFDVEENKLDEVEKYMIEKYDTMCPNGYNIIDGGNSNKKYSKATRERMSKSLKKRYSKEKHCWSGRNHTSASKEKMSKPKVYADGICPLKGKTRPKEVGEKISKARLGKYNGYDSAVSKTTILILPDGTEEKYGSLREACNKYNLHSGTLSRVISGKFKQHKGFKAYYMKENS